jgi:hypothetical protein
MVLVEWLQKRKAAQDVEDGVLFVPDDDLPRLHTRFFVGTGFFVSPIILTVCPLRSKPLQSKFLFCKFIVGFMQLCQFVDPKGKSLMATSPFRLNTFCIIRGLAATSMHLPSASLIPFVCAF